MTRVATGGLAPLLIGSGRAVIAALLAVGALVLLKQRLPRGVQWVRVAVVAGGVVVGFPLFSSFALATAPASHAAVVIALLPAATAVAAVIRAKERPPLRFWLLAGLGAVVAIGFASLQGGGVAQFTWADLLLFGAVVSAAIGYAEGALLARELGAWQTVSWALVVAAPLMIVLTAISVVQDPPSAGLTEWAAFAYVSVVSMFLAFFAWYRGLAIGPIARVSQVQLIQPVITIGWAAILLREPITWVTAVGGIAVIVCAAIAVRARPRPPVPRSDTAVDAAPLATRVTG